MITTETSEETLYFLTQRHRFSETFLLIMYNLKATMCFQEATKKGCDEPALRVLKSQSVYSFTGTVD